MPGRRQHQLRLDRRQRLRHAVAGFAVASVCLLAAGCVQRTPAVESPEQIRQRIERTFLDGDLVRAERDAESALRRYTAIDPAWESKFRVELAKILLNRGQSQRVVTLLDAPLPKGSSTDDAVLRELYLALAQEYLGDTARSDEAMKRAEDLHPQGALQAELTGIKGNIKLNRDDLDAAGPLLQLALTEARESSASFLQTRMWNNLGVLALKQFHYDEALDRFTQASTLAQGIGARVALHYALDNLGWLYYQTGDFARALQNERLAAAQAAAGGATQDEEQATVNAGMIEIRMGDSAAALASYQRALALAEALHNPEKLGNVHASLAFLLLGIDPDRAEDHIRRAAALAKNRKNGSEEQLEAALLQALLAARRRKTTEAETGLLGVIQLTSASPWLQWKAENTLAALYADARQPHKAEVWFERAIDTFQQHKGSVTKLQMQLPFFENGIDLYLSYMEYLIRLGRTEDALGVLDRSRAELLAQGLHKAAPHDTGRARQGALAARPIAARLGATILVYCLRPRRSYLWAIDAKREMFYELAGAETILPLLQRHADAIHRSKDLLVLKDSTGRALYDALALPASALVPPGGRVFVIADKELSGLNFETLIPPGPRPHYWIEDATFTNARSLRLLSAADLLADKHPHPPSREKLLLIGDAVYRPGEYAPLPHAAAEMTQVASHFAPRQRSVFRGAAATPAVYESSVHHGYSLIHFVAHATADSMSPLDSAIILSNSAGPASPYKLYAGDILGRPLEAELVTISSCYGSGRTQNSGEGLVGLVWAFLRAGAHTVIGATWAVSDASTPQLMDSLYAELLRGGKPDAALRQAKLTMLREPGIVHKPLYWASFQLYAGR